MGLTREEWGFRTACMHRHGTGRGKGVVRQPCVPATRVWEISLLCGIWGTLGNYSGGLSWVMIPIIPKLICLPWQKHLYPKPPSLSCWHCFPAPASLRLELGLGNRTLQWAGESLPFTAPKASSRYQEDSVTQLTGALRTRGRLTSTYTRVWALLLPSPGITLDSH